jgi:hypothetical protein
MLAYHYLNLAPPVRKSEKQEPPMPKSINAPPTIFMNLFLNMSARETE